MKSSAGDLWDYSWRQRKRMYRIVLKKPYRFYLLFLALWSVFVCWRAYVIPMMKSANRMKGIE
jgi:hypothetical protein